MLYCPELGKQVQDISLEALEKLLQYEWPGNIRELENLMERAMLLTTGQVIKDKSLPQLQNRPVALFNGEGPSKTIEENERDYIIATLVKCKGKVSGAGGAAEVLNIKVSTLNSRIKKLGIKKEHYFC